MTEPNPALYELALHVERLRRLADTMDQAIDDNDRYTLVWSAGENTTRRARLRQLFTAGLPDPQTQDEQALVTRVASHLDRIREVDGRYRRWLTDYATAARYGIEWVTHSLANLPTAIDAPSVATLRDRFKGVPAIIVAAGPSQDHTLPLMARAKGKAVILAMNQTAVAAARAGAPPDLIVTVDSANLRYQFDGMDAADMPRRVARISVHPSVLGAPGRRPFVFSSGIPHEDRVCEFGTGDRSVLGGSGSVAHFCFSLANLMGCSPIILTGQDLAIADDRLYSSFAADARERLAVSSDARTVQHMTSERKARFIPGTANRSEALEEVPGYGGGTVLTTQTLALFIAGFKRQIEMVGPEVDVINATGGGAAIPGAREMPFDAVLNQYCVSDVPVGQVIEDAAAIPDVMARIEHALEELAVLGESLELVERVGRRCLDAAAQYTARGSEVIELLEGEERRLRRALRAPSLDILTHCLVGELRDAIVNSTETLRMEEAVGVMSRFYEALVRTSEQLRTTVESTTNELLAQRTELEVAGPESDLQRPREHD